MAQAKINPTDPQPTCNICLGYSVPASELEAYTKKAIAEKLVDQQVRDIDIGKVHIAIGVEHRGKLDKPGNNGSEIRNGLVLNIKSGEMVVIPAGTGHWFTKIDDHIDCFVVRIDPDKITPLKSEAQSMQYLSKPAGRGQ